MLVLCAWQLPLDLRKEVVEITMNEMRRAAAGLLYDANYDEKLLRLRRRAKEILFDFNHTHPRQAQDRIALLKSLLGKTGENLIIEGPFHCDYGFNIEVGENFYANANLVILDGAKVSIGSSVFIAPNVGIYTAGHPMDAERRNQGLEYALPVMIKDNVWIGAGVTILPGVTLGEGCVIGAGCVVTKDVPPMVLFAGNPGRVIRPITDEDKLKFA
ncbi:sugar O-acetyltransferase [Microvirga sp. BT689]|uniref:sugar O-acetyltransferase n=1 Tax=Microvirga arvi TaxID=2778731 RepID=UPI00194F375A|nr:sugar O-acetyltransferase [Microvirga arvi]MBM6583087.1 sugar O-acetyltransferase [Microvirga arvi]